jgi:hypothetical protein
METTIIQKKTYIYALLDGTIIKYVGKSDDPHRRKHSHITESIKGNSNTHKCNWINKMISNNKEIGLRILETVSYSEWEEKEKFWIKHYGLENLVNVTIGGLGNIGINGNSILKYKKNMKRDKNIKITTQTHKLLKEYCEKNGLKMFAYVEKLIKERCIIKKDIYGDEVN